MFLSLAIGHYVNRSRKSEVDAADRLLAVREKELLAAREGELSPLPATDINRYLQLLSPGENQPQSFTANEIDYLRFRSDVLDESVADGNLTAKDAFDLLLAEIRRLGATREASTDRDSTGIESEVRREGGES